MCPCEMCVCSCYTHTHTHAHLCLCACCHRHPTASGALNPALRCRQSAADRCLVMSNTERLISRFNWFPLQQGHSQALVCACACVCVPHNWGVHIPISSASCAPVWSWQRATGPFPRGVLNVYGPEVPALCTPPWYARTFLCMRGACWNSLT